MVRTRTQADKEQRKIYNASAHGKMTIKTQKWLSGPDGLKVESEEELQGIYCLWLESTNCEKCGNGYTQHNEPCMDHDHYTGKFRNILCHPCNMKIKVSNTSGVNGISKNKSGWRYKICIAGASHSKWAKDKDWLIQYKLDYENKYIYNN